MTEADDDFVIVFEAAKTPGGETQAERDGAWAEVRRPGRTYVSKTTSKPGDPGTPARYIHKVFDPDTSKELEIASEGSEYLVTESPQGRHQVKLLVAREAGHVSEIWLQRIVYAGDKALARNVFNLGGDDARRLVGLLQALDVIPVEGGDTIRIDDDLFQDLLRSPEQFSEFYRRNPDAFRQLIAGDRTAEDVVAVQHRRVEVERFRRLLFDDAFFDAEAANAPNGSREAVWQTFFEANPWILGTGLGAQLYTSWDDEKLEQVVAGMSIAHEGKRADAVMRTTGAVRWMTFAEFKHHRTPLLDSEYRSGAWMVSSEVAGGVAQVQATVKRAVEAIGARLPSRAADGSELPNDVTFLTQPRSFLVVGHLGQLLGKGGGPHPERIRSFELFRRNLAAPEIVTFDELLARAEWVVGASGVSDETERAGRGRVAPE